MSTLVLCPLEEEVDSLIEGLSEQGHSLVAKDIGRVSGFLDSSGDMFIAQGGLGKATFGIRTQHLIDQLGDVRFVICAGTSGGLSSGLSIGDVVIGTEIVEHDFRMEISGRPLPRFTGHDKSLELLRDFDGPGNYVFGLHFGPIASGDQSIVDSVRANEIRASTGAFAVAWEGAGGARACQFSNVPYLEIRGISDFADHAAPEQFFNNLPSTMKNVASVVGLLVQAVL